METAVIGLGLIGGSVCLSLKRAGYSADGFDISDDATSFALENGIIGNIARDSEKYDLVIVALPPQATLDFITMSKFKDGAIVADVCGLKGFIEQEVEKTDRNFRYIGTHPMAGKEVSGIRNACAELFDGASVIITHGKKTDESALEFMRGLVKELRFGYLVECSAEIHDRKIAYTSQLAHIVSNAYVKDGEMDFCLGFTGGSFQDMTRIAGVDEKIWAELYLKNAGNISEKIESVMQSLAEIKDAIDGGNPETLESVLRHGRELFEKGKKISDGKNIIVKKL